MDFTVIKLNTFSNLTHVSSCHILVSVYVVDLFLKELRMRELGGQLAIIGEQEHARRVAVQTSDRVDALITGTFDKIHHRLAVLRIVAGRDIVLGLVQQYIDFLFNLHRLIVELHFITALHLRAELSNDDAVHADHTSFDERISLST